MQAQYPPDSASHPAIPPPIRQILAHLVDPTSPPPLLLAGGQPQTGFQLDGPHAEEIGLAILQGDIDQSPEFDPADP